MRQVVNIQTACFNGWKEYLKFYDQINYYLDLLRNQCRIGHCVCFIGTYQDQLRPGKGRTDFLSLPKSLQKALICSISFEIVSHNSFVSLTC